MTRAAKPYSGRGSWRDGWCIECGEPVGPLWACGRGPRRCRLHEKVYNAESKAGTLARHLNGPAAILVDWHDYGPSMATYLMLPAD